MSDEADLSACAALVARADPDRFAATMAAPVPARRVLLPLYAFNVEVARAPWVTQEPMIAEMRLQWWRDALEEISAGGPVRRHEVVTPLAALLDAPAARLLDDLIEARRWDIGRDPFDSATAFESYIDATAGHLSWVAARCLGAAPEAELRAAAFAGGVANFLRAVPDLQARGRQPLPDTRPEAVSALAAGARERLSDARRKGVGRAAAPALFWTWQAGAVLARAERSPGAVAAGALAPSEFRRRAGLLWMGLTGRW